MSPKKIADFTIFESADESWILCRGTNVARFIPVALVFVSMLVGIGALPAAHAEPIPPNCSGSTAFVPGGGGEAKWEKCAKEGTINVSVTLRDTKPDDGKCAEAVIDFQNGTPRWSYFVCDEKPSDRREFSDRADDATIWVQLRTR